jgi:ABC-type transporter Mla subunit MlaD
MSAETHKFKVGLFVVGGIVLVAVGLIWLGASKFFSATVEYVTYIDESVQGLDVGSAVKFMGVSVGTTTAIQVAPDGKLVEVRMEMKKNFRPEADNVAQLAMAGITGMKFIEVVRDPEEKLKLTTITFPPARNYIPATTSSTQKIFDEVGSIAEKLEKVDFEGISDATKTTISTIGDAADRLKQLLAKAQSEDAMGEIAATLEEIKSAAAEVNGAMSEIHKTVFNFNQTFARVDDEVTATLINLRNTTANLSHITSQISEDPAQSFLGRPAPERGGAPTKEDER